MSLLGSTYSWKKGARGISGIDPEIVGARLEGLAAQYGGGARAEDIVADAREDPASPYHDYFEWNDAIAGERYREEQARDLIRHLVVIKSNGDGTPDETVRAFVLISTGEVDSYVGIRTVLSDSRMRSQMLERALKDLRVWRKKYETLRELTALFKAIDVGIEVVSSEATDVTEVLSAV